MSATLERGALATRGLSWTPWGAEPTLAGVDLEIRAGERVLLTGGSGSGKTTLLRAIAGVLEDYAPGDLSGEISLDGDGVAGLLMQNPTDQVVAGTVGRDVAFGPENVGVTGSRLRGLVGRLLDEVALNGLPIGRRSTHLSGGQGQRLGLAGLLGLAPSVLLLDEPLSMLDPSAAAIVRSAILDTIARSGASLIVADHDLEGWWAHVDRVVVLEHGRKVYDGPPSDARARLTSPELWLPGSPAPAPTTIAWEPSGETGEEDIGLSAAAAAFFARGERRLSPTDLEIEAGDGVAITGPSGAGKTTLLRLLAGWVRPTSGAILAANGLRRGSGPEPHRWSSRELASRIAFVPQHPQQSLVAPTVLEEVLITRRLTARFSGRDVSRARELLDSLGLAAAAERNPHTLSGGEQRRLAIAAAIAGDAPVVLLDEPTVGQDRESWRSVASAIAYLRASGRAVAASTHDSRLADVLERTLTINGGQGHAA